MNWFTKLSQQSNWQQQIYDILTVVADMLAEKGTEMHNSDEIMRMINIDHIIDPIIRPQLNGIYEIIYQHPESDIQHGRVTLPMLKIDNSVTIIPIFHTGRGYSGGYRSEHNDSICLHLNKNGKYSNQECSGLFNFSNIAESLLKDIICHIASQVVATYINMNIPYINNIMKQHLNQLHKLNGYQSSRIKNMDTTYILTMLVRPYNKHIYGDNTSQVLHVEEHKDPVLYKILESVSTVREHGYCHITELFELPFSTLIHVINHISKITQNKMMQNKMVAE